MRASSALLLLLLCKISTEIRLCVQATPLRGTHILPIPCNSDSKAHTWLCLLLRGGGAASRRSSAVDRKADGGVKSKGKKGKNEEEKPKESALMHRWLQKGETSEIPGGDGASAEGMIGDGEHAGPTDQGGLGSKREGDNVREREGEDLFFVIAFSTTFSVTELCCKR